MSAPGAHGKMGCTLFVDKDAVSLPCAPLSVGVLFYDPP